MQTTYFSLRHQKIWCLQCEVHKALQLVVLRKYKIKHWHIAADSVF